MTVSRQSPCRSGSRTGDFLRLTAMTRPRLLLAGLFLRALARGGLPGAFLHATLGGLFLGAALLLRSFAGASAAAALGGLARGSGRLGTAGLSGAGPTRTASGRFAAALVVGAPGTRVAGVRHGRSAGQFVVRHPHSAVEIIRHDAPRFWKLVRRVVWFMRGAGVKCDRAATVGAAPVVQRE